MCGIAGIYAYSPEAPGIDREELIRVRDHMINRGPDGCGQWYAQDGRIGLAHRRLSIIDLSERGAQPMISPDGRFVITFNGEIYNYRALRQRLETKGVVFQSDSDTEVLLHLYAQQGARMLGELRGMFAFGIWDDLEKKLFLARDPYGIKPLYYADDGRSVRFASQVKALAAGGAISAELDRAALAGFLMLGSVPEPFTVMSAVKALPAGSFMTVSHGGADNLSRYFSIASAWRDAADRKASGDAADAHERIADALRDSVEHHQVADVAVGAFLSAGIDSGALVGLMTEGGDAPETVTVAFDEYQGTPDDESPLAEQVARQFGATHSRYVVTETDFRDDWPRIQTAMDQPSIDGVNTWFVSKAARAQGLKVAVSGLGGDELFGGYPSFTDLPRWTRLFAIPTRIKPIGRMLRKACALPISSNESLVAFSPKACGLPEYGGTYPGAWLVRRGLFMPWELPGLMGKDAAREGLERLRPLELIAQGMDPDPSTPFGRVAALEASLYMKNQLLRDADWAGMAHSLEIRVPLVDTRLLQKIAPMAASGEASKVALASAPRKPLPAAIRNRPKTGFTVPFGRWIDGLENTERDLVPADVKTGQWHWSKRLAYSMYRQQAA